MSSDSGVGVTVKHYDGTTVYNIILGLMAGEQTVTADGMAHGFESHAMEHVINYFRSLLSTVKISAVFPKEIYDETGQIAGSLDLPYIAVRGYMGASREVGVGGIVWEDVDGVVYAFNQVMMLEFDVFATDMMKVTQIANQIMMKLQWQKRTGGYLWQRGFQNFETVQSDAGRGFRYDTPWDFKMQHQYADLFHTRLIVRTKFDVVWKDNTATRGIISRIVFGQTEDIPFSTFIGSPLPNIYLEEMLLGWHGNIFP